MHRVFNPAPKKGRHSPALWKCTWRSNSCTVKKWLPLMSVLLKPFSDKRYVSTFHVFCSHAIVTCFWTNLGILGIFIIFVYYSYSLAFRDSKCAIKTSLIACCRFLLILWEFLLRFPGLNQLERNLCDWAFHSCSPSSQLLVALCLCVQCWVCQMYKLLTSWLLPAQFILLCPLTAFRHSGILSLRASLLKK